MTHQSTSRRRGAFNGDEVEAYSRWRWVHAVYRRPGAVKAVKRRTNRRERREGRREARSDD